MNPTPEQIVTIRRLRKQNGYSIQYIAQHLNLPRQAVSDVMRADITPLNRKVDRRYAKCQERGGCVPSDVYVVRPFPSGDIELPVCKRCEVPMRGSGAATRWKLAENTTLFRPKRKAA